MFKRKILIPLWIVCGLATLPLLHSLSCNGLPAAQDQSVLVTQQDLKAGTITTPGDSQQAFVVPIATLPGELRKGAEKLFPGQTEIALTTLSYVKPVVLDDPATPENEAYAPKILPITPPATEEGKIDFIAWIEQAAPALLGLLPEGLAAWGPLGLYLLGLFGFKRSRGHLGQAAKDLSPMQDGIDIIGAIKSVGKAVGYGHSLQTPEELRAIADKIETERLHNENLKAIKESK